VTELGVGHNTCCRNRKAPKTPEQFFALNYPSNPHGHDEVNNRVHNPERVRVTFEKEIHKKIRKGWYFRMKGDPDLLDGSGDGKARGKVRGYVHKKVKPGDKKPVVNPVNPGDRVVCFNAANLKMLAVPKPGGPLLEPYGFTFTVPLSTSAYPASGWMPLSAVKFNTKPTKNRAILMASLRTWACCLERYAKWGRSLAKKTKTYKLRTTAELAAAIRQLTDKPTSLINHFRESSPNSLGKRIKHARKRADQFGGSDLEIVRWFRGALGIFKRNPGERKVEVEPGIKLPGGGGWAKPPKYKPTPGVGNKLGDYLPKPLEPKPKDPSAPDVAHTNFCGNISVGKRGAITAPIPIDIFPQGHTFHRLEFKGKKRAWGYLYSATPGKVIGKAEWYYGYCDVVEPAASAPWKAKDQPTAAKRKQRRYGWVPALAVQ
jgi:hypothetical protein